MWTVISLMHRAVEFNECYVHKSPMEKEARSLRTDNFSFMPPVCCSVTNPRPIPLLGSQLRLESGSKTLGDPWGSGL